MKFIVKETGFIFNSRRTTEFKFAVMRHSTCEDRFVPMELFVERVAADKYLARELKTGRITGEMAKDPDNFRIFSLELVKDEKAEKTSLGRIARMMEQFLKRGADLLPEEQVQFAEVAAMLRQHAK